MLNDANGAVRDRYGLEAGQSLRFEELQWDEQVKEYGYYDSNTGQMVLNERTLSEDDPTEAIDTLAHENRHAFQGAAMRGEVQVPPDTAAQWRHAAENYPVVSDYDSYRNYYEAYRNNALEVDARQAAECVRDGYARRLGDV